MDYPVLIGSRAAKWHIPSFREPNDWDFIATASQSALFIKLATLINEIKLIHCNAYGVRLKIIGECVLSADKNPVRFEIEIVSDKINLKEKGYDDDDGIRSKSLKVENQRQAHR